MATVAIQMGAIAFTPTADMRVLGEPAAVGVLGVNFLGAVANYDGQETATRNLQFGACYEGTEGSPAAPCLALQQYGYWRFRWVVAAGNRSVTVYAKQASNAAGRPSIVIRENSAVGLLAPVTTVAGSSTDWIAMTASFVSTGTGFVWVELHNNEVQASPTTCYFDRISVI